VESGRRTRDLARAELIINSVGCSDCRPRFQAALLEALGQDVAKLCQDCQRRAKTNPLRIYDCKVPADQPIIDALPHSIDYLDEACATHFAAVRAHLDNWGIPWRLSHRLVRGLDYYTRTTFEILGEALGAQNALLGGGRYDGLVKSLGGPDRTGIGFAAGIERLVLALPAGAADQPVPRAFVAVVGDEARTEGLRLLRELRQAGLAASMEFEGRSIKSQMKRADRLGARVTLIVGVDELAKGEVTLRDMRGSEQRAIARADAVRLTRAILEGQ
jgi:histidyl-tRNA synthetase